MANIPAFHRPANILTLLVLVIGVLVNVQASVVEYQPGDWVYFFATETEGRADGKHADQKKSQNTVYFASREDPLFQYSGRPGQIDKGSLPHPDYYTVKYQTDSRDDAVFVQLPKSRFKTGLLRCPPGQESVKSTYAGVIRAWRGTKAMPLEEQTDLEAGLGDQITVEVLDFDRWLFRQLDFGRLPEAINDAPVAARKYVQMAVESRRAVQFFYGLKQINLRLLSCRKNERSWQAIEDIIERDSVLAQMIKERVEGNINWAAPEGSARGAEAFKLEQIFGPLTQWQINFTKKYFPHLTLTINGVVLHAATPTNPYNEAEVMADKRPSFPSDTYHWLVFDLERKPAVADPEHAKPEEVANRAAWDRLLGQQPLREKVRVSLTLPDVDLELETKVDPDPSAAAHFEFIGIKPLILWTMVGTFGVILGFLGWLAATTDILRDTHGAVRPDGIAPFSLAKSQMAFWFVLMAAAFVFLWMTTDNLNTINQTCLWLAGIGTATALGASLIPSEAKPSEKKRDCLVRGTLRQSRQEIAAQIDAELVERLTQLWNTSAGNTTTELREQIVPLLRTLMAAADFEALATKLGFKASPEPGARVRLQRAIEGIVHGFAATSPDEKVQTLLDELSLLGKQKREFENMPESGWRRLFSDWFNDDAAGNSYQLHRFQMLGWTLILGVTFIIKLFTDRTMPEFSDTTLTLLGISSGTYLGFKLQPTLASTKGNAGAEEKGN